MEKDGVIQEFTGDRFGVSSKSTVKNADIQKDISVLRKGRKTASDLTQNEVAEITFDMIVNHRMMEMRLEKVENRLNALTSLMIQKGFNIPNG